MVFWVFVLFHPIFFAFPLLKRFRGTSPSFVLEKAFLSMLGVCVLVCVSTWIFIYFLCFEPTEAISSGLLLLLC